MSQNQIFTLRCDGGRIYSHKMGYFLKGTLATVCEIQAHSQKQTPLNKARQGKKTGALCLTKSKASNSPRLAAKNCNNLSVNKLDCTNMPHWKKKINFVQCVISIIINILYIVQKENEQESFKHGQCPQD